MIHLITLLLSHWEVQMILCALFASLTVTWALYWLDQRHYRISKRIQWDNYQP